MTTDPLISAALLGVARMTVMPPPPDPSLEEMWNALAALDPADGMLQALALTRALHRAGVKLLEAEDSAPACVSESREVISSAAVDSLMRLLKGEYPEILPEWLDLASGSGRVLPGRVLPEILTAATKDPTMRATVRHLSGERGIWIARRHPKFSWLLEDDFVDDSAWDDGTPTERITWLRQTRASDPPRAMAAVASHWAGEDAPMREAILRVISDNPLTSDETWLEKSGLTDRRQEIRELATASLTSLTKSAFRKRLLDRVRSRVKIQRRLLKRVIVAEPPDHFDPSWKADGLKERPPQGTGEKAWWLRQLIAMVPINDWPVILGCSDTEVFSLPVDGDWKDAFLLGLLDSARRRPAPAAVDQVVPYFAKLTPWPIVLPPRDIVLMGLLDAVPVERRFGLLDSLAKELNPTVMLELLARCRQVPPEGTGKAALAVIEAAIPVLFQTITRPQARALALCIPLEGIQQRLETLSKLPELPPAAEEFATTLEFRRSLRNHL